MALTETLVLDTAAAFADLNALERQFDSLDNQTIDVDVTVDDQGFRNIEESLRAAETAADGLALEVSALETASDRSQANFAGLARELDVSEDEARRLAGSILEARAAAARLEDEASQVARQLDLSEDEAEAFTRELRQAARAADDIDTRTAGLATSFRGLRGLAAGALAGFGLAEFIDQTGQAIRSATDLSESINAVNVVFGDGAGQITSFAETAASSVGLAASEVNQLVVPIGAALTNFGFGAEQAASAAIELTERAADLASVFNTDVSEALGAIQAALRGEADPLERFGGSISAARVEAFALAQGLAASKGEIDDQIRLQARLGLILSDTAFAAGDFANTADELPNRLRTLQADAENLRAELGTALLPAFESLVDAGESLVPVIEGLIPSFERAAVAGGAFFDSLARPLTIGSGDGEETLGFLDSVATGLALVVNSAQNVGGALAAAALSGGVFDETSQDLVRFAEDAALANDVLLATQSTLLDLQNLDADASPVESVANGLATLAEQGGLTAESIESFLGSLGEAGQGQNARRALEVLLSLADTFELTDEQIRTLESTLDGLRFAEFGAEVSNFEGRLASLGQGAREAFADVDGSFATAEESRFARVLDEATLAADTARPSLSELIRVADEVGVSFDTLSEATAGGVDLFANLSDADAAAVSLQLFADAASDTADQVAESFDIILSETNKAGDEIPQSAADIASSLEDQAADFAEFEANLTELAAGGFTELATRLRQEGPSANEAVEGFLRDALSADRAEAALSGTSPVIQPFIDQTEETLANLDLEDFGSDAFLTFADGGTSSVVRATIVNAANELARLFEQAFQPALSVSFGDVQTSAPPTSTGGGGGGGTSTTRPTTGTGGVSEFRTLEVNINNPTTQDVTTSAAQAAQIVGSIGGLLE